MKLSSVRAGQVFVLGSVKGIVLSRTAEDRSSGYTDVHFDTGHRKTFLWDKEDPDVVVVGFGRVESQIVMKPPALFQKGDFTLRSGKKSAYKIECDSLTFADWEGIAAGIMEEKLIDVPFSTAVGVPRGGVPLANALGSYVTPGVNTLLICEDVVTTGGSIEKFRREHVLDSNWDAIRGVVFIARGKCPDWVVPFLQQPLPTLTGG